MCKAAFAKNHVALAWVLADSALAEAWVVDLPKTTVESNDRHRRRLNDQLIKVGLTESKHVGFI